MASALGLLLVRRLRLTTGQISVRVCFFLHAPGCVTLVVVPCLSGKAETPERVKPNSAAREAHIDSSGLDADRGRRPLQMFDLNIVWPLGHSK